METKNLVAMRLAESFVSLFTVVFLDSFYVPQSRANFDLVRSAVLHISIIGISARSQPVS